MVELPATNNPTEHVPPLEADDADEGDASSEGAPFPAAVSGAAHEKGQRRRGRYLRGLRGGQ